jgi:hypothetical protein
MVAASVPTRSRRQGEVADHAGDDERYAGALRTARPTFMLMTISSERMAAFVGTWSAGSTSPLRVERTSRRAK